MDDDFKGLGFIIISMFFLMIVLAIALLAIGEKNNQKVHSDDVSVTEWISPDGVHYWYQREGYHAMLAPRYDKNGNLVIDEDDEERH